MNLAPGTLSDESFFVLGAAFLVLLTGLVLVLVSWQRASEADREESE